MRLFARLSAASLALSALLTGCSLNTTAPAVPEPVAGLAMHGTVHGGQQPIVGAHVYLLAAGSTGYGTASLSLLTSGLAGTDSIGGYVKTDANGAFTITGDYTCLSGQQAYLLATGGDPGLGAVNPNLSEITAIGQCPVAGTYATNYPFLSINEITTVASVYALSGFMTDITHVASSGTAGALTGIANAFANVNNLADIVHGGSLAATPQGSGTAPQAEINTLADIIASCVNSSGSGSTPCTTLFANAVSGTTHPTDTATAALYIAHSPAANVANLFALQTGTGAPYTPTLTAQPNDFTVALSFTGGGINGPISIAVDGTGFVWTVNADTTTANSITELNGVTGVPISPPTGFTGNGLNAAFAIAIDSSSNAWVVNAGTFGPTVPTTVSEFSPTGAAATGSPFSGGGLNVPANLNTLSPRDIAFDASGNAWIANSSGGSVTELNGLTGTPISPSSGFILVPGSQTPINPNGIAVDSAAHVWVSGFNGNTLYEVDDLTGIPLGASSYKAGGLEQPYSVAIDASNNIWLPNQYDPNTLVGVTVSEFPASLSPSAGSPFSGGGILGPVGVAIDGLGNVWIANQIHGSVTELNNNGTAISPSTGYKADALFAAGDVAIDSSGNVWVPNAVTPATFTNGLNVVEFVGAAAPVVTPIATAVKTKMLGTRP